MLISSREMQMKGKSTSEQFGWLYLPVNSKHDVSGDLNFIFRLSYRNRQQK